MATYTRKTSSRGWIVGTIVAAALLGIGYLVFSANGSLNAELRGPVEELNGGQILVVDTSNFIVKKQDGACVNLVRKSPRYFWYQEIDCPGN